MFIKRIRELFNNIYPTTDEFFKAIESQNTEYLGRYLNNPPCGELHTMRVAELGLISAAKAQSLPVVKFLLERGVLPVATRTCEMPLDGLLIEAPKDYAFGESTDALEAARKTGNAELISMMEACVPKRSGQNSAPAASAGLGS